MCVIVGITGGIASGKTTLAKRLATKGYSYFNADDCVHQLYAHDRAVQKAIAQKFPDLYDGMQLNRVALSAHLSRDPELFSWLENLLHPRVRAAEMRAIARATRQRQRGIILDIPLLFETGADVFCDMVITAQAPEKIRRRRALARGMKAETLARVLARQYTDHQRARLADIVIHSGLGKAHAWRQLQRALTKEMTHA